jgi:hypothetical protein
MPSLHQNPSRNIQIHLLSNDLASLFNKVWDEAGNTVVKNNYICSPNYIIFVFNAKTPLA